MGVNAFQQEGEEGPINKAIRDVAYRVPSVKLREEKVREVKVFKESRNRRDVERTLREIYKITKVGSNLTPAVIEAAKVGVTLGEVTGVIRLGYGIPYDPFEEIEMPKYVREAVQV